MVKQLALFGDPVMHSLSPRIHIMFAEQFGIELNYQRILTPKGELSKHISVFKKADGLGGNITVPIKSEAYNLCHRCSERAEHAKAINTFWWENNELVGDNTDGEGFLNYLEKHLEMNPSGKSILLLGAGGAASALASIFTHSGLNTLWIVNRDIYKAESLAEMHPDYKALTYDSLAKIDEMQQFDWVINATSCSLQNKVPKIDGKWLKDTIAIDLSYCGGEPTSFMSWALKHSAGHVDDGLGMLVEQAALGFESWFQKLPDTYPVLANLRSRE